MTADCNSFLRIRHFCRFESLFQFSFFICLCSFFLLPLEKAGNKLFKKKWWSHIESCWSLSQARRHVTSSDVFPDGMFHLLVLGVGRLCWQMMDVCNSGSINSRGKSLFPLLKWGCTRLQSRTNFLHACTHLIPQHLTRYSHWNFNSNPTRSLSLLLIYLIISILCADVKN